tara:strand:+ start:155 stop:526 length:372 start_codon:yes stop_codon:yes gene_type:complete
MTKKKISFEDSLEDTDFGLIISSKGELKGMYMPDGAEDVDYVPEEIVQILYQVYGMDIRYRFCYYSLMRRNRKPNPREYIEVRIKQLIDDRRKAHDKMDKEWYLRLISELRYVLTVMDKEVDK